MAEEQYKNIQLLEEETIEETVEPTETPTEEETPTVETPVEETETVPYQAVAIAEEHGSLVTRTGNGKVNLCFITEGQGSSGYYDRDILQKSYKLLEGRPMYIDHHRGKSDPGILYWVGDIESSYYDAKGIEGPGIYGTATVFERWKDVVEDMVRSRGGVSIKARGHSDEKGNIKNISVVESVDYVVRAGRGGRVMELFESAIAPKLEEEVTQMEEKKEEKLEESAPEATPIAESTTETPSSDDKFDMDAVKKMFVEMLDQKLDSKFDAIETRLGLFESEAKDREIVSAAVREAAGEDDFTEDMLKNVESIVWESRGKDVDLTEKAKETVALFKPVFDAMKKSTEDKINEAKKQAIEKSNTPTILERMNEAYAGKDGEEISEEELEKQLASSISKIVDTNDVKSIHESIVNARGE